ncbi:hypothetical protein H4R18_001703 [Coemansia javaensis]|uniref:RRM domain-containing protein n=1 Tax=Coemansia javaensis TaxID=2761396 RepID=A0A9W8LKZ7_9FUNG|nr:hypothetical protein H4R18_001703 [Coemansia javaensis]
MSASPEIAKAVTSVEDLPNKVFVGNLPFKTTDEQLKEFFASVGEVVEARVITRGKRSLGYGFVAFAAETTVGLAVQTKDKTEMDGRPINVEAARPLSEDALKQRAEKPAPRRRRRRPARRAAEDDSEAPAVEPAAAPAEAPAAAPAAAETAEAEAGRGRRQPRFQKKRPEPREGTPSDTVVYVGNLPFSTTDDELSALFAGFSISSAHVVSNKKTGRPKGFGFVTFATPAAQSSALAKFAGDVPVLGDRPLQIKAALSETPAASDSVAEPAA